MKNDVRTTRAAEVAARIAAHERTARLAAEARLDATLGPIGVRPR